MNTYTVVHSRRSIEAGVLKSLGILADKTVKDRISFGQISIGISVEAASLVGEREVRLCRDPIGVSKASLDSVTSSLIT
jgi:hypothetical protein